MYCIEKSQTVARYWSSKRLPLPGRANPPEGLGDLRRALSGLRPTGNDILHCRYWSVPPKVGLAFDVENVLIYKVGP